ncbi:MAG: M3 family oligoendopeptidase, partial [Candidatus Kapabacteria bacterium]|nr:M3 family oligoendopeptidase [Candidatus Kapabacteria bacterium]
MTQFKDIPYTRPDFNAFKENFTSLMDDFKNASSWQVQDEIMQKINDARNDIDTDFSIVSVRNSIDTTDPFYETEQEFMDNLSPLYSELVTEYYKVLAASPYRNDLENKWGKQLFRLAEMSAKCISPEVIEDLQHENTLSTEYQKLLASAKIMFDGEERNLAAMAPYMQHTDRSVRQEASKAKWAFFTENSEQLDRIYDDLVRLRTSIAHKLGFKNYVDLGYMRMARSDYNEAMVAGYR